MAAKEGRHHFLVVAYGVQSHINPGRALAHRLTRLGADDDGSIVATLSVPLATHRRMFPSLDADGAMETSDGAVSCVPHSDGADDGSAPKRAEDWAHRRQASYESISTIVAGFAAGGRPVTCIVCTMLVAAVLDVAREHGIPLAIYWIQPATVLAADYHYFRGYGKLVASHATDPEYEVSLPGLSRPLKIGAFPSYLVDTTGDETAKAINEALQELLGYVDQGRPKFLVNTFDELEAAALEEMKRHLDVFAVGPMVSSPAEARIHLFKHDEAGNKRYMGWLGAQPEKSVVYASFGSLSKYSKQQIDEMVEGLQQCGRPYLLVLRDDVLDDASHRLDDHVHSQGIVVEWCDQLEVLSHPAVGCFVTHSGWNSTLEAVASGVPVISIPGLFDQPTNAYLVEQEWAIGTKCDRDSEGLVTRAELARRIDLIMGETAQTTSTRERVEVLKQKAQEAACTGGPAERNLTDFIRAIPAHFKA